MEMHWEFVQKKVRPRLDPNPSPNISPNLYPNPIPSQNLSSNPYPNPFPRLITQIGLYKAPECKTKCLKHLTTHCRAETEEHQPDLVIRSEDGPDRSG